MPVWGSHLGTSQTLCTPLRVSTRSRGSCSTEDPEWVIIVPLCQRETPLASGLASRDQQGGCGALTPPPGLSRDGRLRPPLSGFPSKHPLVPLVSVTETVGKTANNLQGHIRGLQMSSTLQRSKPAWWATAHAAPARGQASHQGLVLHARGPGPTLHARGPGPTHVLQFCKTSLGRRSRFSLFPILARFL